MDYHAKKVLALPFGEYFNVFDKIFTEGKKEWSWDVHLVTTSSYFKPYKNFISSAGQLYVPPGLLKKQDWESDPKQCEAIRAIMMASEKIVRIPLNRILLSHEREAGRAYSKANYYWPEGNIAQKILKNKKITDKILLRAFKFAMDVILDFKPDFCLGGPTGGITNAVFYFVTKYYGIPYISCSLSMVIPNRHFWSSGWGSFNVDVGVALRKMEEKGCQVSSESARYLKEFRKAPEPMPYYKKVWKVQHNRLSLLEINKYIFQRLVNRLVPIIKGEKIVNPKPFFQTMLNSYREYFLKKIQRKLYSVFTDNELSKFKYIYYPFHQEPEFVLNLQAPFWYNQLNTIKMLSYNLPAGYKLIVREHRNNVGRRSSRYLKEIGRYPGVILVDAFDDQYKYIKNANLLVTVNGTSGLEGILLKKNVMILDRTSYDALGLAFRIQNPTEFASLLLDAVENKQFPENYDERLGMFFDAEREVTFSREESPQVEMTYIQNIIDEVKRTDNLNVEV